MAMSEAGGPHTSPERNSHAPRSGAASHPPARRGGLTLDPSLDPIDGVADYVASGARGGRGWLRNWASHDWITAGYLVLLLLALLVGRGPNRGACIERVSADLGFLLCVLALVRGNILRWDALTTSLVYRVSMIVVLMASFFQLREILPAVSPWTVDDRIYAFDMRVFGFEASVALDRFVNPTTTEWFAFFYFLYFIILCVHVLPMVFWSRDLHLLNRFATGVLLLYMTAHIVYMIVPGYGPYWYLKDSFTHELRGGTFLRLVRETVDAGGAQKDIFPSLHTAAPTFFAIFSYRHRDRFPFRYTWPLMGFIATQVIIATMFLRWHYMVDILAGLTFAFAAQFIGQYVADWERAKRKRLGLQDVWMPLRPGPRGNTPH